MKRLSQKTHMLDEIYYQKELAESLIAKHLDFYGSKMIFSQLDRYKAKLQGIKKFIFLGCGSSANASILAMYYFEEFSGIDCEFEYADEFIGRKAVVKRNTAVVLLSQSGKSKDVVRAADIARERGAYIISICNTPGSYLDRMADISLLTNAGPEKAIAATKSFFSQVMICLFFSVYTVSIHGKKMSGKEALFTAIKKLPQDLEKTLELEKEISSLATRIKDTKHIIVTGRKYNYPIALEGAHKIKETAYIHAEGMASEELRHGAEAMLDKDYLVISMIPGDETFKNNIVLARELKKTKTGQILVSDKNTKTLRELAKLLLKLPKTHEVLNPFLNVVVYQLLAFHLAMARKVDITKPRNIRKFVA